MAADNPLRLTQIDGQEVAITEHTKGMSKALQNGKQTRGHGDKISKKQQGNKQASTADCLLLQCCALQSLPLQKGLNPIEEQTKDEWGG